MFLSNEALSAIAPANDVVFRAGGPSPSIISLRPHRARLSREVRRAARVGLAAVLLHALTIVALVALARGRLGLLAGFAVAGLEFLVARAVGAVGVRASQSGSEI